MAANTPPLPHNEGDSFTNDDTNITYEFINGAWRAVSSKAAEDVADAIGAIDLQKVLDNGNVADKGATFGNAVVTTQETFEDKELVSREFVDHENDLQDQTVQRELDNINERIDELVGSSIMAHYTMGSTSYPTLGNVCMFSVANSSDPQYLTLNWNSVKELSFNPKDADGITHDLNNIRPYDVVRFVGQSASALFRVSKNDGGGFLLISETLVSTGSAQVGERYAVEFLPGFDPSAYATKSYVDDKFQESLPIGSIVFWGGTRAKIPSGWKECDGSTAPSGVKEFTGMDKLPDLREYMPAGAGGKFGTNVGDKNNSKLKRHKHNWPGPTDRKGYPHGSKDTSDNTSTNTSYWRGNKGLNTSSSYGETTETGDNFTAPPVYIGIYIMKVA